MDTPLIPLTLFHFLTKVMFDPRTVNDGKAPAGIFEIRGKRTNMITGEVIFVFLSPWIVREGKNAEGVDPRTHPLFLAEA